ncbi:hypothetical protein HPB50_009353 [Hyalomma asiaticum]|uniref:Uncharacterized protein n=1 Tax=Hyalomma asiaticum TaxID=266040 RepID=A0ACB7RYT5_HYAAI|nr:hypothetical protein HPB50_009353 [Hyalomma asiaticum]
MGGRALSAVAFYGAAESRAGRRRPRPDLSEMAEAMVRAGIWEIYDRPLRVSLACPVCVGAAPRKKAKETNSVPVAFSPGRFKTVATGADVVKRQLPVRQLRRDGKAPGFAISSLRGFSGGSGGVEWFGGDGHPNPSGGGQPVVTGIRHCVTH